MALVPIKNIGKAGVVKDTEPALLPENVMTDALNVRFRNGSVETIKGESVLFSNSSIEAEYGIHWRRPDFSANVTIKDGKAYFRTSAGTESVMLNSVDATYTGSRWMLDKFGGGYAVFINNGTTTPMYALYNDPTADLTFQAFPGWNYIPGTTITAKVIRPLGYALVAANLTFFDGTDYVAAPVTIRISTQAIIGGFPTVWQPGLTTDTADELEIDSDSAIVDMLELRGNMMIYSYSSIHMHSINNGIASVKPYIGGHGVMNPNCVVEFDNQHFVVDRNDIYVHNGSGKVDSVAEGVVKDFFYADMHESYLSSTFAIKNSKYREIWVCYADTTSTTGKCNKAMIFNYVDKSWTFRTLPEVVSMFEAPELSPVPAGTFRYGKSDTILACNGTIRVLVMDSGYQMVTPSTGALYNYSSYISRDKVFAGDPLSDNYIGGVGMVFKSTNSDDTVDVTITSQNVYDKAADYSNTSGRDLYTITPKSEAQGYKIDARQLGRFLNYKIASSDYWKLSYMALDINPAGRR